MDVPDALEVESTGFIIFTWHSMNLTLGIGGIR